MKHNIDIYKSYLNTIESTIKRRNQMHTLFLTINMAFCSLFLILISSNNFSNIGKIIFCCAPFIGIFVNIIYIVILCRIKKVIKIKYEILCSIEKNFDIKPFILEYKKGKNKEYKTFGSLGHLITITFMLIFITFFILIMIYLI